MKYYVVFHGKVTETDGYISPYGKTVTYKTICGTTVAGAHSDYVCDKNGKSLNSGEYHNFKDDFFPWVNGKFIEERLLLNPICDCK